MHLCLSLLATVTGLPEKLSYSSFNETSPVRISNPCWTSRSPHPAFSPDLSLDPREPPVISLREHSLRQDLAPYLIQMNRRHKSGKCRSQLTRTGHTYAYFYSSMLYLCLRPEATNRYNKTLLLKHLVFVQTWYFCNTNHVFPISKPSSHLPSHLSIHPPVHLGIQQIPVEYLFWSSNYANHSFCLLPHCNLTPSLKVK